MTDQISEVTLQAGDGWKLGALLRLPDAVGSGPGVVTVPGSRHERDAWTSTADALASRGIASLMLDIRGRGSSRGRLAYSRMTPAQRRLVTLDVAAALECLAERAEVDAGRLGIVAEQDTAADALAAAAPAGGVRAVTLVSPRHSGRIERLLLDTPTAVHALASTEDREGIEAAADAYLAADPDRSRIDVYRGLGIGITMAAVRQFEQPDEQPIEDAIAGWLAHTLADSPASG